MTQAGIKRRFITAADLMLKLATACRYAEPPSGEPQIRNLCLDTAENLICLSVWRLL